MRLERYQPDFDIDLAHGKVAEKLARELLFGIRKVEVKREDRAPEFGTLFIETECDKGRKGWYEPSGLRTTGADYWGFLIGAIFFYVPTVWLRNQEPHCKRAECHDGDCPTKGFRLPLAAFFGKERG